MRDMMRLIGVFITLFLLGLSNAVPLLDGLLGPAPTTTTSAAAVAAVTPTTTTTSAAAAAAVTTSPTAQASPSTINSAKSSTIPAAVTVSSAASASIASSSTVPAAVTVSSAASAKIATSSTLPTVATVSSAANTNIASPSTVPVAATVSSAANANVASSSTVSAAATSAAAAPAVAVNVPNVSTSVVAAVSTTIAASVSASVAASISNTVAVGVSTSVAAAVSTTIAAAVSNTVAVGVSTTVVAAAGVSTTVAVGVSTSIVPTVSTTIAAAVSTTVAVGVSTTVVAAAGVSTTVAVGVSTSIVPAVSTTIAAVVSSTVALGVSTTIVAAAGVSTSVAVSISNTIVPGVSTSVGVSTTVAAVVTNTVAVGVSTTIVAAAGVSTSVAVSISNTILPGVSTSLGVSTTVAAAVTNTAAVGVSTTVVAGVSTSVAVSVSNTIVPAISTSVGLSTTALAASNTVAVGVSTTIVAAAGVSTTVGVSILNTIATGASTSVAVAVSKSLVDGISTTVAVPVSNTVAAGLSTTVAVGVSSSIAAGISNTVVVNAASTIVAAGVSTNVAASVSNTIAAGASGQVAVSASDTIIAGISTTVAAGVSNTIAAGASGSVAAGVSNTVVAGVSTTVAVGASNTIAAGVSGAVIASVSNTIAAGISTTVAAGVSNSLAAGASGAVIASVSNTIAAGVSTNVAAGVSNTIAAGASASVAVSISNTVAAIGVSTNVAVGVSNTIATNVSANVAAGVSNTIVAAASESVAVGVSNTIAAGISTTIAVGVSSAIATGISTNVAAAVSNTIAAGASASIAVSASNSIAAGISTAAAIGVSNSAAAGVSVSAALGISDTIAAGISTAVAISASNLIAAGVSVSAALGVSTTVAASVSTINLANTLVTGVQNTANISTSVAAAFSTSIGATVPTAIAAAASISSVAGIATSISPGISSTVISGAGISTNLAIGASVAVSASSPAAVSNISAPSISTNIATTIATSVSPVLSTNPVVGLVATSLSNSAAVSVSTTIAAASTSIAGAKGLPIAVGASVAVALDVSTSIALAAGLSANVSIGLIGNVPSISATSLPVSLSTSVVAVVSSAIPAVSSNVASVVSSILVGGSSTVLPIAVGPGITANLSQGISTNLVTVAASVTDSGSTSIVVNIPTTPAIAPGLSTTIITALNTTVVPSVVPSTSNTISLGTLNNIGVISSVSSVSLVSANTGAASVSFALQSSASNPLSAVSGIPINVGVGVSTSVTQRVSVAVVPSDVATVSIGGSADIGLAVSSSIAIGASASIAVNVVNPFSVGITTIIAPSISNSHIPGATSAPALSMSVSSLAPIPSVPVVGLSSALSAVGSDLRNVSFSAVPASAAVPTVSIGTVSISIPTVSVAVSAAVGASDTVSLQASINPVVTGLSILRTSGFSTVLNALVPSSTINAVSPATVIVGAAANLGVDVPATVAVGVSASLPVSAVASISPVTINATIVADPSAAVQASASATVIISVPTLPTTMLSLPTNISESVSVAIGLETSVQTINGPSISLTTASPSIVGDLAASVTDVLASNAPLSASMAVSTGLASLLPATASIAAPSGNLDVSFAVSASLSVALSTNISLEASIRPAGLSISGSPMTVLNAALSDVVQQSVNLASVSTLASVALVPTSIPTIAISIVPTMSAPISSLSVAKPSIGGDVPDPLSTNLTTGILGSISASPAISPSISIVLADGDLVSTSLSAAAIQTNVVSVPPTLSTVENAETILTTLPSPSVSLVSLTSVSISAISFSTTLSVPAVVLSASQAQATVTADASVCLDAFGQVDLSINGCGGQINGNDTITSIQSSSQGSKASKNGILDLPTPTVSPSLPSLATLQIATPSPSFLPTALAVAIDPSAVNSLTVPTLSISTPSVGSLRLSQATIALSETLDISATIGVSLTAVASHELLLTAATSLPSSIDTQLGRPSAQVAAEANQDVCVDASGQINAELGSCNTITMIPGDVLNSLTVPTLSAASVTPTVVSSMVSLEGRPVDLSRLGASLLTSALPGEGLLFPTSVIGPFLSELTMSSVDVPAATLVPTTLGFSQPAVEASLPTIDLALSSTSFTLQPQPSAEANVDVDICLGLSLDDRANNTRCHQSGSMTSTPSQLLPGLSPISEILPTATAVSLVLQAASMSITGLPQPTGLPNALTDLVTALPTRLSLAIEASASASVEIYASESLFIDATVVFTGLSSNFPIPQIKTTAPTAFDGLFSSAAPLGLSLVAPSTTLGFMSTIVAQIQPTIEAAVDICVDIDSDGNPQCSQSFTQQSTQNSLNSLNIEPSALVQPVLDQLTSESVPKPTSILSVVSLQSLASLPTTVDPSLPPATVTAPNLLALITTQPPSKLSSLEDIGSSVLDALSSSLIEIPSSLTAYTIPSLTSLLSSASITASVQLEIENDTSLCLNAFDEAGVYIGNCSSSSGTLASPTIVIPVVPTSITAWLGDSIAVPADPTFTASAEQIFTSNALVPALPSATDLDGTSDISLPSSLPSLPIAGQTATLIASRLTGFKTLTAPIMRSTMTASTLVGLQTPIDVAVCVDAEGVPQADVALCLSSSPYSSALPSAVGAISGIRDLSTMSFDLSTLQTAARLPEPTTDVVKDLHLSDLATSLDELLVSATSAVAIQTSSPLVSMSDLIDAALIRSTLSPPLTTSLPVISVPSMNSKFSTAMRSPIALSVAVPTETSLALSSLVIPMESTLPDSVIDNILTTVSELWSPVPTSQVLPVIATSGMDIVESTVYGSLAAPISVTNLDLFASESLVMLQTTTLVDVSITRPISPPSATLLDAHAISASVAPTDLASLESLESTNLPLTLPSGIIDVYSASMSFSTPRPTFSSVVLSDVALPTLQSILLSMSVDTEVLMTLKPSLASAEVSAIGASIPATTLAVATSLPFSTASIISTIITVVEDFETVRSQLVGSTTLLDNAGYDSAVLSTVTGIPYQSGFTTLISLETATISPGHASIIPEHSSDLFGDYSMTGIMSIISQDILAIPTTTADFIIATTSIVIPTATGSVLAMPIEADVPSETTTVSALSSNSLPVNTVLSTPDISTVSGVNLVSLTSDIPQAISQNTITLLATPTTMVQPLPGALNVASVERDISSALSELSQYKIDASLSSVVTASDLALSVTVPAEASPSSTDIAEIPLTVSSIEAWATSGASYATAASSIATVIVSKIMDVASDSTITTGLQSPTISSILPKDFAILSTDLNPVSQSLATDLPSSGMVQSLVLSLQTETIARPSVSSLKLDPTIQTSFAIPSPSLEGIQSSTQAFESITFPSLVTSNLEIASMYQASIASPLPSSMLVSISSLSTLAEPVTASPSLMSSETTRKPLDFAASTSLPPVAIYISLPSETLSSSIMIPDIASASIVTSSEQSSSIVVEGPSPQTELPLPTTSVDLSGLERLSDMVTSSSTAQDILERISSNDVPFGIATTFSADAVTTVSPTIPTLASLSLLSQEAYVLSAVATTSAFETLVPSQFVLMGPTSSLEQTELLQPSETNPGTLSLPDSVPTPIVTSNLAASMSLINNLETTSLELPNNLNLAILTTSEGSTSKTEYTVFTEAPTITTARLPTTVDSLFSPLSSTLDMIIPVAQVSLHSVSSASLASLIAIETSSLYVTGLKSSAQAALPVETISSSLIRPISALPTSYLTEMLDTPSQSSTILDQSLLSSDDQFVTVDVKSTTVAAINELETRTILVSSSWLLAKETMPSISTTPSITSPSDDIASPISTMQILTTTITAAGPAAQTASSDTTAPVLPIFSSSGQAQESIEPITATAATNLPLQASAIIKAQSLDDKFTTTILSTPSSSASISVPEMMAPTPSSVTLSDLHIEQTISIVSVTSRSFESIRSLPSASQILITTASAPKQVTTTTSSYSFMTSTISAQQMIPTTSQSPSSSSNNRISDDALTTAPKSVLTSLVASAATEQNSQRLSITQPTSETILIISSLTVLPDFGSLATSTMIPSNTLRVIETSASFITSGIPETVSVYSITKETIAPTSVDSDFSKVPISTISAAPTVTGDLAQGDDNILHRIAKTRRSSRSARSSSTGPLAILTMTTSASLTLTTGYNIDASVLPSTSRINEQGQGLGAIGRTQTSTTTEEFTAITGLSAEVIPVIISPRTTDSSPYSAAAATTTKEVTGYVSDASSIKSTSISDSIPTSSTAASATSRDTMLIEQSTIRLPETISSLVHLTGSSTTLTSTTPTAANILPSDAIALSRSIKPTKLVATIKNVVRSSATSQVTMTLSTGIANGAAIGGSPNTFGTSSQTPADDTIAGPLESHADDSSDHSASSAISHTQATQTTNDLDGTLGMSDDGAAQRIGGDSNLDPAGQGSSQPASANSPDVSSASAGEDGSQDQSAHQDVPGDEESADGITIISDEWTTATGVNGMSPTQVSSSTATATFDTALMGATAVASPDAQQLQSTLTTGGDSLATASAATTLQVNTASSTTSARKPDLPIVSSKPDALPRGAASSHTLSKILLGFCSAVVALSITL